MKVGVSVATPVVPAWQALCVRALRSVAGIDVTVVAASPMPWRPEPMAALLGGRALAAEQIACDASHPAGGVDVMLDLAGDGVTPVVDGGPAEPPHGVWRFRLGAYNITPGGLPFVHEVSRNADAVEVALVRGIGGRDEDLRRGLFPVTRWHPSTVRWSLSEAATWPATFIAALRDNIAVWTEPSAPAVPPERAVFDRFRFALVLARRLIGYAIEMLFERVEWNVGWVPGDARLLLSPQALDVRWMPRPARGTFIADPFVVERDGRRVMFVEQYDYVRDRGVIEALELGAGGDVISRHNVLDLTTHLSYPFPIDIDGALHLIPESAAAGDNAFYRCVAFPWQWERVPAEYPVRDAVDTTIFEHDERWWALCTRASRGSTVSLHAFHAESPRGPWTAHVMNPVVVDVSCARPAGAPFSFDGALYRPGQDCTRSYGGALVLARIDELTPVTYRETIVRRRSADSFGRYASGFHTVGMTSDAIVIDGKHLAYDLWKVVWKLRSASAAAMSRIVRRLNIGRTA